MRTSGAFQLAFLATLCFSLATWLEPRFAHVRRQRTQDENLLTVLLGDSRRLFANHFTIKADAYFHAGYYPTFIDQALAQSAGSATNHAAAPVTALHQGATRTGSDASAPGAHAHEHAHEHDHDHDHEECALAPWLGEPLDWLDRFSRNFFPSEHVHLEEVGESREVLPWVRLAADLDPHNVGNFVVGAYWLRSHMGQVEEAEAFLREGWRANPDSAEILFELGRLLDENRQDPGRARNVWELALRKWQALPDKIRQEEILLYRNLVARLADLERREGNRDRAIFWLKALKPVSAVPDRVQEQIDELTSGAPESAGAKAAE